MKFTRIGWEKAARLVEELAGKVSPKPDMIIGISRGGLVPARILSDAMGVRGVGVLGIAFYKKIGETYRFPRITQELDMDLEGIKVLIVDDVADTGRSLAVAREYVRRKGASDVRTATLHYKPGSIVKPDYFIERTTAWIVYPWERHEVDRELKGKKR